MVMMMMMNEIGSTSSAEGEFSADYLELHTALRAGEQQRRNDERRKSTSSRVQDVPDGPAKPRRTYSCKYPSSSTTDSTTSRPRQVVRRRESARDIKSSRSGRNPQNGSPSPGGSDLRRRSSLQVTTTSAPQSRSGSYNKLRRPRDVREFRQAYSDPPSSNTAADGSCSASGQLPSMEDAINAKLHQLKLLQEGNCCVVRCFDTSAGGIINRGDSFKRKHEPAVLSPVERTSATVEPGTNDEIILPSQGRSRSQSGSNSTGSCGPVEPQETTCLIPADSDVEAVAGPDCLPPSSYTVLVLGDDGVGRTALLQQFMTSHFLAAETTFDTECEKTVSVLLNGEETTLNFVDLPRSVQKDCIQYTEIEAYLVVFSLTDRQSFRYACAILRELRQQERSDAAIILVANKSDLVRARQVSDDESKAICESLSCKYTQVSAALNHRVDELLAGLVHQIRLNPTRQNGYDTVIDRRRSRQTEKPISSCFCGAKEFFAKLLLRKKRLSTFDCDNLWIL